MRSLSTILLAAATLAVAAADTVHLKNGNVVQGTYLGGTARQVRIDVNGNIQTFEIGEVTSIRFDEAGFQAAGPPPAPAPAPEPSRSGDFGGRPANDAHGLTIPADTTVTIRMIEGVNSQTARLG